MSRRTMRVRFDIAGGDLRPRYLDDQELPEWQNGPTMVEYLNQMSEQGWRLATHLNGQEYIFEQSIGSLQSGASGIGPNGQGSSLANREMEIPDQPTDGVQQRDEG